MRCIPNDQFVVLAVLDGKRKAIDYWLRCYNAGWYSWETNGATSDANPDDQHRALIPE